jgi:hypothetical protein
VDYGTNPNPNPSPNVDYGTNPHPHEEYDTVITPNYDFIPIGPDRGFTLRGGGSSPTPLIDGSDHFLIPSMPDQVTYF